MSLRPFEVSTTITSLAWTCGSGIFPDGVAERSNTAAALFAFVPEDSDLPQICVFDRAARERNGLREGRVARDRIDTRLGGDGAIHGDFLACGIPSR